MGQSTGGGSDNVACNRTKKLHRLAYPEQYRLSSGAELVSGWIPNRMYHGLSITTLFHGNEFKNTAYNLPQNLLDKYDSGAITLHELVNELFEPWEQVDESQHSLLAVALQPATGGIPTPQVGTGSGGSSSDLTWNDNDKDKYQRPKFKVEDDNYLHGMNLRFFPEADTKEQMRLYRQHCGTVSASSQKTLSS